MATQVDEEATIGDDDLAKAVQLAVMTAALRMGSEVPETMYDVLEEAWPDGLDANALQVAVTVAMSVAYGAALTADDLIAMAMEATVEPTTESE